MRKLLEGRPLGHPLHTLIAHLPVGLWFMSLMLDGIAFDMLAIVNRRLILHTEPWPEKCAFLCIAGGSVLALLAIITGFIDWLGMRDDHPSQPMAIWHMALNMTGTTLFISNTGVRWKQINHLQPSTEAVALSLIGMAIIAVGGYLGGRLVYANGVGVGRHRGPAEPPEATLAPGNLSDEFVAVGALTTLGSEKILRVDIRGVIVCVVIRGGQVSAFQEFCTHRCGPLSEGHVAAGTIECPWHKSVFNMATGEVLEGPAKEPLRVFQSEVRGGMVYVRVPLEQQPAPDQL
jgi:nitrite reductase/ring-hydroxylating ferredoxin subunit/uncharacterized membrane protein